jgi:hypothetical protein
MIIVARGRYSLAAGSRRTIKLTLNRPGRGLFQRFHRLPAVLTVSGATKPARRIVFKPGRTGHRH